MTIEIVDVQKAEGLEKLLESCAAFAVKDETGGDNFEICLTLSDGEGIRALNAQYRGIDKATDVLSFPLGENGHYDINPETGAKMLGDVVLSMERAMEQSEQFGHSLQREVGYLTVHSILHLLGYDHVDGGLEAVRMREREEAVMSSVGLPRGESYVMLDKDR